SESGPGHRSTGADRGHTQSGDGASRPHRAQRYELRRDVPTGASAGAAHLPADRRVSVRGAAAYSLAVERPGRAHSRGRRPRRHGASDLGRSDGARPTNPDLATPGCRCSDDLTAMNRDWESGPYDVLEKRLVVVFCGLNPSVDVATTGRNFGSPS